MATPDQAWFVGAMRGSDQTDMTADFVQRGVWECDPSEHATATLSNMRTGDRIAIKAAFTKKNNLPFDNRDQHISTMRIKAAGVIEAIDPVACKLRVRWNPDFTPRDWYFYTGQSTFWRIISGNWKSDALLAFAFENAPQDYDMFRNAPQWASRFGDQMSKATTPAIPDWVPFHAAIAKQLLNFATDRRPLMANLHAMDQSFGRFMLRDQPETGVWQNLDDICPFTLLALAHRGNVTPENQRKHAATIARAVGLELEPPPDFPGVPRANNQSTWFFAFAMNREPDDIDRLWRVFTTAAEYDSTPTPEARAAFTTAFDNALTVKRTKWNLTFGLFWYFPHTFLPLDSRTRQWLEVEWKIPTPQSRAGGPPAGETYLALCEQVQQRLNTRETAPFNFIQISEMAFRDTADDPQFNDDNTTNQAATMPDMAVMESTITPYTVADILTDGCFLPQASLDDMLAQWRRRKNLILQGAPGTGKTWLAQRLGWALAGYRKPPEVVTVQFHPGVSYEDFVRGYRPGANERFEQVDGPFMHLVARALRNPGVPHVLIIEEINRGNPAHIFGELLTLLEDSKRSPEYAMELTHPPRGGRRAEYIPDNVYLVGTMNMADRSIALVDVALRRRFAFFTLEPQFNDAWRNHAKSQGVHPSVIDAIRTRLLRLNNAIADHHRLGSAFAVGHSFVTPTHPMAPDDDGRAWFSDVIRTEIQPLLEEYCFDSASDAKSWLAALRLDTV